MDSKEKDFLYQSIGNRIRELRQECNFSQDQLSKKLGLSRVSVVNIEKGRQHPSIHILIDVARALNVPISEFVHDNILTDFSKKTKITEIRKKLIAPENEDIDTKALMKFINSIKQS